MLELSLAWVLSDNRETVSRMSRIPTRTSACSRLVVGGLHIQKIGLCNLYATDVAQYPLKILEG
jgi:hypothetical protein